MAEKFRFGLYFQKTRPEIFYFQNFKKVNSKSDLDRIRQFWQCKDAENMRDIYNMKIQLVNWLQTQMQCKTFTVLKNGRNFYKEKSIINW